MKTTLQRPANKARFWGIWPVFKKEVIHLKRDITTIGFALFVIVFELLLVGYGVNFNVRQIKTVVYDLAHTQESRELLQRFSNTDDFNVVATVNSDKEMYEAIVGGKARVAIKIPIDYSTRLMDGRPANILLLVDGSDGTLTFKAISVANTVTLLESVNRLDARSDTTLIETRPTVLFNPDTKTANFIIPGMIALSMQGMLVMMVASAVVREHERGTLEQLSMTPVRPLGLIIGKMLPYVMVGLFQQSEMLLIMRFVFDVKIQGSYLLLLLLTFPYLLIILGYGLLISTKANSLGEAHQMALGLFIISFLMSGYFFPIDNMPIAIQWFTKIIPASYFVDTLRAIIVRGAGIEHVWVNGVVMLTMGTVITLLAANQFKKRAKS